MATLPGKFGFKAGDIDTLAPSDSNQIDIYVKSSSLSPALVANSVAYIQDSAGNKVPLVNGVSSFGDSALTGAVGSTAATAQINVATAALKGALESADLLTISGVQGRNSSLAVPRVFRPIEYSVGNTYDPTGATNSTASFAAMMTAVIAFNDRCIIELPPGVFLLDNTVFTGFGAGSIAIKGPGRGYCVLVPSSAGTFITMPTAMTGADAFLVSGFTIFNTGSVFTSGIGINVNGCDGAEIKGISFINLHKDVTVTGAAIKVWVTSTLHFHTNGSATSVGIEIDNGDAGDTYLDDIVMSNGGATRRRASVEIIESGHYRISNSNLTGSAKGILIAPTGTKDVNFGFHTNVLCDSNNTNGMDLNCGATGVIKNIKSVNSWYSGTTSGGGAGVRTQGSGGTLNGVTFSCDRFLNNQTHGFQHEYGTDFRWDSCDMKGNNQAGTAAPTPPAVGNSGLFVGAAVSNWSVNGGKYGGTDTVPTAANQDWGIYITAGAGDLINISPDDLSGNRTGPIMNGATGVSVFVDGCPGLAAAYHRGAPSSLILGTNTTIANMLIPKNSVRISTTYKCSAVIQASGSVPAANTIQVRIGTATDVVGAAATNAVISPCVTGAGALNDWINITFYVTVSARDAAGNFNGAGGGTRAATAFSSTTVARASTNGFIAIATTQDLRLTMSMIGTATLGLTAYTSSIECINY